MTSNLRFLLGDTVTRLFTDLVTKELIESAERGVWPDKLWRALEEGGLTLPLVPESGGGAGGAWLDAHVVVRAAGHHAAPVPLAETIVASAPNRRVTVSASSEPSSDGVTAIPSRAR